MSGRHRAMPLLELDRCEAIGCEDSLGTFMRRGWHHANEPSRFITNWHIDCMVDHFTAAIDQQLGCNLLIFTMPPRHNKTIGGAVFLPAWTWCQDPDPDRKGHGMGIRPGTWRGPGTRFVFISYSHELSKEPSEKCLALIKSEWYQRFWHERFTLTSEGIRKIGTNRGGVRRAMSFSGALTGFGAEIIYIDDAHNRLSKSYERDRVHVLDAWDNALPSRLNDKINGLFIIAMQRTNENDLVGHILAREFNGIHVCLPYEFEAKHPHVFRNPSHPILRRTMNHPFGPKLGEPWEDLRSEGEELWKERFPKAVVLPDIQKMTSHDAAGQYQQRPTPPEGLLFKRDWFQTVVFVDETRLRICRAWDCAATAEAGDYTVGVKMGIDDETGAIYILNVVRGRWSPAEVEKWIVGAAAHDGERCTIRLPQDPGSAGKFQALHMLKKLQGFDVWIEREESPKPARANPFAAQCEHGMVRLVEADWNHAFVEELCAFRPDGKGGHDDQVDAVAAAFRALTRRQGGISLVAA